MGKAPTLENWVSSASAGGMPRFSHILLVRAGQDEPAKIRVLRIVLSSSRRRVGGAGWDVFKAGNFEWSLQSLVQ